MNEEIKFRKAASGDCRGIADLMGQLGYTNEGSVVKQRVARLSALDSERIIVAEKNGSLIGVASAHLIPLLHAPGNICRITSLVVAKEYHGQGIGRRLIMEAEAWAWDHDCSRIEVTSGDSRTAAHQFYKAVGYTSKGKRFLKQKDK